MSDFIEAIYRIRYEFLKEGLNVPKAIVLSSREEGLKLMNSLRAELQGRLMINENTKGGPRLVEQPNGDVYYCISILGIEIHWPAVKVADRQGGYHFE